MDAKDVISRRVAIGLQIELLETALADNQRSWMASGFAGNANPVADSIRRDIAQKRALLVYESPVSRSLISAEDVDGKGKIQ